MDRPFDRPTFRVVALSLTIAAFAAVAAFERDAGVADASPAARRTQAVGPVAAGARVRVKTVAGDVTAAAGVQRTVAIRTHFTGRDAASYGLHVDRDADGLTVCATRIDEPDATCDRGPARHVEHDSSYVDAIDVTLPAGVALEASTVSGGVRSRGVATLRTIATVSGPIDVGARAATRIDSVSGTVKAALSAAPGADLEIKTVDGSIDLALPRGDYRLNAHSLSGSIASHPPLLVGADETVGKRASVTLGGRKSDVTLESVSGPIGVRFL